VARCVGGLVREPQRNTACPRSSAAQQALTSNESAPKGRLEASDFTTDAAKKLLDDFEFLSARKRSERRRGTRSPDRSCRSRSADVQDLIAAADYIVLELDRGESTK